VLQAHEQNLAYRAIPQSGVEKLHCNPPTTQSCLNTDNTLIEDHWRLKLPTIEFGLRYINLNVEKQEI
jgi:hypothetical protein